MPNSLIHESSPYLLQHAHNPVNWYAWGEEALQKAKAENKLILISIGYSACHWCHVMEHESFENEAVAAIMNAHYVCIKVDREERPDIDQIYMSAVQLINGQGGWPLNCIALPDQRPIYGGTYFRKDDWKNILQTVAAFYQEKPAEAEAYAVKLTQGVQNAESIVPSVKNTPFTKSDLEVIVTTWKQYLDFVEGGHSRAPKFPLPNNFLFLLRYAHLFNDEAITVSVRLTLEKMALGGIYDQIGGGFARYSVDGKWLVPHFEKMLYDNAQLTSLYAEAYQCFKDPLYKQVVAQTIAFVNRELIHTSGGFYSALDADSEGVEGKFYTWTFAELQALLTDEELKITKAYYQITESGNWHEEHTNILHRKTTDDAFIATDLGISVTDLHQKVVILNQKLFDSREMRIRPGLDDKMLTSWNALMLAALVKAYTVFGEDTYLEQAIKNAHFLWDNLFVDGRLYRNYKNNKASIPAFLDDYAFLIQAYTTLYQATFDEQWIEKANTLAAITSKKFSDEQTGLFFYTSSTELIARKHEIQDNVIPSANSAIANALFELGILTANTEWVERAQKMLATIHPQMARYGSAYSNWAILLLNTVFELKEVVLSGNTVADLHKELNNYYLPQKIVLAAAANSTLALVKGKESNTQKLFVCKQGMCSLPVTTVAEAIQQI